MERRTGRGWLLLGGGVLIAIIGAGAAVHHAWDDLDESMCGNELLHENVSPDGKMKVVVFQRDCGATTGFSTQASIIPAGDALPKKRSTGRAGARLQLGERRPGPPVSLVR